MGLRFGSAGAADHGQVPFSSYAIPALQMWRYGQIETGIAAAFALTIRSQHAEFRL